MAAHQKMTEPKGRVFGVQGRLAVRPDGSGIQCHLCGGYFVNLAQHARRAHDFAAPSYRRRFRLPRDVSLAAPVLSERLRTAALRAAASRPGTDAQAAANAKRSATLRALPRVRRPCDGCGVAVETGWTRRAQGRVYCPARGAARVRERRRLDMRRRRARQRFLAVQDALATFARPRRASAADPRTPRRLTLEQLARQLLADLLALDPAGGVFYGILGELAAAPDGQRVQCHLCGRFWINLSPRSW
jgi:hypothetical protein